MDHITVSYKKLKKICEILEKQNLKDEDQVAFEFIVGSLFPDVLQNIKEEMRRQHAAGYAEGLAADRNEVMLKSDDEE